MIPNIRRFEKKPLNIMRMGLEKKRTPLLREQALDGLKNAKTTMPLA
jgi:hypothetical protein